MVKLPEIKKKVTAFLRGEEGNISKDKIVKVSVIIAAISFGISEGAKFVSADEIECSPACGDYDLADEINWYYDESEMYSGHANSLDAYSEGKAIIASHSHCVQSCHANHCSSYPC